MAYLHIANLKKSYRISRTQTQEVLRGLDVDFKRGEMVAVLGESGCGKSTFINILGGLDNEYTGSVVIDGEFMKDYDEKQLDDYRKSRVGLIFQNYNLISHMTVRENIEIAMTMSNIDKKARDERVAQLLDEVGLADMQKKYPSQLSGGQRQRVAIARALANSPEIVLADEPTGALDKESADQVLQILKDIADSGRLVIIVTHSQKVAENCNRIVTIDDGVIASDEIVRQAPTKTPKPKTTKPQNIRFKEIFHLAVANQIQSVKRSLLVSIGMAIGIAAIILVFCLSGGITSYVNNQLATSSTALLIRVTSESSSTNLTAAYSRINGIEGVDYVIQGNYSTLSTTYSYENDDKTLSGYIMNIYTFYNGISENMSEGEICEEGEIIVSEYFAEQLYRTGYIDEADELLGTEITLTMSSADAVFTISGIYDDTSEYSSYPCAYLNEQDMEDLYEAAGKSYKVNILYVYVEDISYISAVKESIEYYGYTATRDSETVETILDYVDIGTAVLTAMAVISIIVSAIMIFIVTYISVIERTKEIGILRAVGGRKKDVVWLFLLESAIIGTAAGLIAVVFSLLISITVDLILQSYLSMWIIKLNPIVYVVCFLVSILVSVGSGMAPSVQASGLDPVESLRTE